MDDLKLIGKSEKELTNKARIIEEITNDTKN
jgi:hypothetical protein